MATKKTFYVTTAIDYVNSAPHIGHAYQKIVADVLARWYKLRGYETLFLTGTDEHGKKVAESAKKEGKSPREFVDEISEKFKQAWKVLEIQPDRFIRTTDPDHQKVVIDFVKKCNDSGDIYKGKYSGLYCVGCEAYYTEKDLINGECPFHPGKKLEHLEEETYFFKLSKYQKYLLELYENPEFILPKEIRNDVIKRVREGLKDFSITRTSFDWGIPFPLDKKHIIYVWFDALINYYTPCTAAEYKKFWPANLHLLGRDNTWFHCVYWPAMLKSAGITPPKTIFNHGFFTFNGQKISKSLGNSISPVTLVEKYGADTVKYFSLRQVPFGEDGDFSEVDLIKRHNTELADKLGNLISRVSTLAERYGLEATKTLKSLDSSQTVKVVEKHLENYEFDKALNEIFAFVDKCNEYVQEEKPWETQDKKVLWQLANAIKDFTILLSPFIPQTAEKISKTFNFEISLKNLKQPLEITKIKKSEILFKKIDQTSMAEKSPPQAISTQTPIAASNKIQYQDFEKVQLKVGKILKAEDHPQAEKLLVLTVDLGEENPRTIVAGLRKHYKKEDLEGRKAVFVANLAPVKLRGIESNGMILAASTSDDSQVIFLTPEKDILEGSKIK